MPSKTTKKKPTVKKTAPKQKKAVKKSVAKQREHAVTSPTAPIVRKSKSFQSLRGFRDILPAEQSYWQFLAAAANEVAEQYGFDHIDLPVVEHTGLFERSVGKVTDIVQKEMFTFGDRSNESITMRPEFTAGAMRAYLEHGLVNQPQPVRWSMHGTLYRYERPQYGRQREFHQWGCEVIGDDHPAIDAQLMIMLANLYAEIGLSITLQLNSIGDKECRPAYRKKLVEYYRGKKKALCETCVERLQTNPLRLLDCKEEQCEPHKADAPQSVDHLCEPCKEHLMKLLEYLDELDIPYVLNSYLVRGFDYYTRTVFEVWASDDERGRTSLAGGGRYDGLAELLGGRPTPAAGFGLGMEATVLKLKEQGVVPPPATPPSVFIAQLGEPAKRKGMRLFEELRKSGIRSAAGFSKDSLKGQMETAARLGVRYALIIGQKEIVDSTIIIRDMEAGIQETYDFKKTIPELHKKLAQPVSAPLPSSVSTSSEGEESEE